MHWAVFTRWRQCVPPSNNGLLGLHECASKRHLDRLRCFGQPTAGRHARMVQSYSPGGAIVHPPLIMGRGRPVQTYSPGDVNVYPHLIMVCWAYTSVPPSGILIDYVVFGQPTAGRHARMVQSYSPGGAIVHPPLIMWFFGRIQVCPTNSIYFGPVGSEGQCASSCQLS